MLPSVRAQIIERRTYLRPLNDEGTKFETSDQAVDRVVGHQRWLWERALGQKLDSLQERELGELRGLLLERKVTLAGRTRWLGGTEVAKTREASQFNCSFAEIRTVHDVVDIFWLLLQGCGVGFRPIVGTLNGFGAKIEDIHVIPGDITREEWDRGIRGVTYNRETYEGGVWNIIVGDSAEAWAKFVGKVMAGKYRAKKLVLDFSEIRPEGIRLKGYGWISSGHGPLADAVIKICEIMNKRADSLLTRIDILDIINLLGTTLSSRRSAEIALIAVGEPEWEEFALAKKDYWKAGKDHRAQSNNTLMYFHKPTKRELKRSFKMMLDAGGSEPGFNNMIEALRRAPWCKGFNPCHEIMLGDKSFCNLVETVLFRFNGGEEALHRAHYLVARANYRQTCVNLRDGILQDGWQQLNEYLRLCGVGVTGVVCWEYSDEASAWQDLRAIAWHGANTMADELNMPRAKAVTTIKPSGTASKTLSLEGQECPEGIHKPLGRYIFNNVNFSKHDPLVQKLRDANYHIFDNPLDSTGIVARLPVEFDNIEFDKVEKDGRILEVNLESAVSQLERYKMVMEHYVDHNASITVSYDPSEVEDIIDWLTENWNVFVGVSFLYRNDPTKTAEDLGYAYLPQQCVDEQTFRDYAATLLPINFDETESLDVFEDACSVGGMCPIR